VIGTGTGLGFLNSADIPMDVRNLQKPYSLMGLILPSNVPAYSGGAGSIPRIELCKGTTAPKSACTIYRTRMKMWAQECNIDYRADKLQSERGVRGHGDARSELKLKPS